MQFKIPSIRRPRFRGARGRTWLILGGIAVLIIILAIWRIAASPDVADTLEEDARRVSVATPAELAGAATPLTTIGTVRSSSEAELRAKRTGSITAVNYQAGDSVPAGAVIATIENASERASLAQAQARVSAAQANLLKVEGGTRAEQLAVLEANVASARDTLTAARVSAYNAIVSAYAAMDNAVRHGVDIMFQNPDGPVPELQPVTTEGVAEIEAENQRVFVGEILDVRAGLTASAETLSTSDLATTETDVREVLDFIETTLTILDGAVPNSEYPASTLASFTTTAQSAQTSLLSSLSGLTSARSSLQGAQSSLTVAQERLAEGTTGAQPEDHASAAASLAEAQAGLAAANAAYENTVVRTPISGTLSSWSISTGDFVTMQQELGVVVNEGALEVVAYVTPRDRSLIAAGNAVTIANTYAGVVTNVATGLDAARNLIEVTIGISEEADLVHGQTVPVSIARIDTATDNTDASDVIRLPLSSIKLFPEGAVVFTLTAENRLTALPVELGDIVGSSIVITAGLTNTTPIVVDARGLSEGDLVTRAD